MSKRFSIAEARAQLPGIIDRVEAGADVELTRRGKSVAVVVSTREYARLRAARVSFAEAFGRFTAEHGHGAGLGRDFVRGLRDRGTGRPVRL
jgi:prevent-host-death family protein